MYVPEIFVLKHFQMQLYGAYNNETVNFNRANFKQLSFYVQTK